MSSPAGADAEGACGPEAFPTLQDGSLSAPVAGSEGGAHRESIQAPGGRPERLQRGRRKSYAYIMHVMSNTGEHRHFVRAEAYPIFAHGRGLETILVRLLAKWREVTWLAIGLQKLTLPHFVTKLATETNTDTNR